MRPPAFQAQCGGQGRERTSESIVVKELDVITHCGKLLTLSGLDPDVSLRRVSEARGIPIPETAEQKEWIFQLPRSAIVLAAHR